MSAETENSPAVSLVISTVDRSKELVPLFDSLVRQTNNRFEALLIDQNDDCRLLPLIDKYKPLFRIQLIKSVRGLSKSRNLGITACRGQIIGFPDDDSWYSDDMVSRVYDFFQENPVIDLLSGRTVDAKKKDSVSRFQHVSSEITKSNIWWTHNSTSIFVRTRALKVLGGFDETLGLGANSPFQSGEETDLVMRLFEKGGRAYYRRDIIIFHDQIRKDRTAPARARRYAPGFGYTLKKHHFGVPYLIYRVLRTFASAAIATFKGDMIEARYKAAWAVGTIKGYVACPSHRPG